jgi:hypothetical protein
MRCWLQTNNLDKLIFVHKNWPSDFRVGCLKPCDLANVCEYENDELITCVRVLHRKFFHVSKF